MKKLLYIFFIFCLTGFVLSCGDEDCWYCSGGLCTFCSGFPAETKASCPNCLGTRFCNACQGTGKIPVISGY
ncbi:MAG: hypothetical protein FWC22_06805 [Treponema sp.]|nr:hypothetical protein [Treponema sp.]